MGIDLGLYRARIGAFVVPKMRIKGEARDTYNPFCRGTDVLCRTIVTCLFLLLLHGVMFGLSEAKLTCENYVSSPLDLYTNTGSAYSIMNYNAGSMTSSGPVYINRYVAFCQRLLMLSSDVELNPGPVTDADIDRILKAIKDSDDKTEKQLHDMRSDMRSDIAGIKEVISVVQTDLSSIITKVESLDERQNTIETNIKSLQVKLNETDYMTEELNRDVGCLSLAEEKRSQHVEELVKQMNYVDREMRRCNLRIFGIPDVQNEGQEETKAKVVNAFAQAADVANAPDPNVCLIFAKRIGTFNSDRPRSILVKFRYPEDKFNLFKTRDQLRSKGIRIANDLTMHEKDQLDNLRKQGKHGYFKNGNLVVLDEDKSRMYRKAVRRTVQQQADTNEMVQISKEDLQKAIEQTQERLEEEEEGSEIDENEQTKDKEDNTENIKSDNIEDVDKNMEDEDKNMEDEVKNNKDEDKNEHIKVALDAAMAVNTSSKKKKKRRNKKKDKTEAEIEEDLKYINDINAKYKMEDYDGEESMVSNPLAGLANLTVYADNNEDPYITLKEGVDSDDEDYEIKDTDNLIIVGQASENVCTVEKHVYNADLVNLYVHDDFLLPSFPLALEWLDFDMTEDKPGNFIAIGTMEPTIDIWDLDVVDGLEPIATLGQKMKKKKKGDSKTFGHKDAVLSLSWNRNAKHVLASASADNTVLLWDLAEGKVATTLSNHKDKVQCVKWHPFEEHMLLSGSFDKTVKLFDCRSTEASCQSWDMSGEIEKILWNHHSPLNFFASTDSGHIYYMDARQEKPLYTLSAHNDAVTGMALSSEEPNMFVTASTDQIVKVWDISDNRPSVVLSSNIHIGTIHCLENCPDNPYVFAFGGAKELKVWDIRENSDVYSHFVSGEPKTKDENDVAMDTEDGAAMGTSLKEPADSQSVKNKKKKKKKKKPMK